MTAAAPPPIVLTGASGFIGRRILQRLADLSAERVTVLTRDPPALEGYPCWRTGWRAIRVDLALDDISPSLLQGAVVLHLAAATGRATPAEMRRANVDGTARMVRAAHTGGAANFVFVSSIAVRYAERRWYHYAESKIEAEALLAASGLAHAIVRPTMVFGQGSPVQRGLAMLSCLPVPVMFGTGEVMTQPVHVDDVAGLLSALALRPPVPDAPVLEVGGRDRLTMAALFARMRAASGRSPRSPLRVPAAPVRRFLGTIEPVLRSVMPLTAGQLAAFVNDSTASPSDLVAQLMPAPRGIDAMIGADAGHD